MFPPLLKITTSRVLTVLLVVGFGSVSGQEWDFLTWHRLKASGNLTKKLSLSVEQQLRLEENSSRIDQTFTDVGLKYDLPKGFDVAAAYRLSWKATRDGSFETRHRYIVDLSYGRKVWKLKPEVRARFQHRPAASAFNEPVQPEESPILMRVKFGVSYTELKDWKPGVEFVAFIRTNDPRLNGFIAYRYRVFLDYNLPKRQELGLFYMVETDYSGSHPLFTSVVGVNYSYEWKKAKKKKEGE